jgi:ketosteroid isomerase-like protein
MLLKHVGCPGLIVRKILLGGAMLLIPLLVAGMGFIGAALSGAAQTRSSDEGGRIQALENGWNHALEAKDANALNMLLANTFVSVDIDGSVQSKGEFLASIKAPEYKPSQVVTEQSNIQMHGDIAVVVGIYRVKGLEKGKAYLRRARFVDTWAKIDETWQCIASVAVVITGK